MSHVKTYTRTSKQGKTSVVQAHDDKRSKTDKKRHPVKHIIKAPDPGAIKMRNTITDLLKTEQGREEFTNKIKAGGFAKTIPEVLGLYGVEQGAHHPLPDAFDHTMELFKHLPKDVSDNVLWGTLLHDIGKPETQASHKTRGVVFDGHEEKGHKMVGKIMSRLGFDKTDAEEISHLVLHHGNLRTQILREETAKAQEFIDHPNFGSLLTVHKADVLASGRDPYEVENRVASLKKTAEFRKHLSEKMASDLGAKNKAVELNDDGSVSLYVDKGDMVDDTGNVDPKVEESGTEALKRNGLTGWKTYVDYDANSKWLGIHFEPQRTSIRISLH